MKINEIPTTDGVLVCLSIGPAINRFTGRVRLSIYDDLGEDVFLRPTPKQAREIAAALLDGADAVDAAAQEKEG